MKSLVTVALPLLWASLFSKSILFTICVNNDSLYSYCKYCSLLYYSIDPCVSVAWFQEHPNSRITEKMAETDVQRLHWSQRVALIRHNLHAASRSTDFRFFKTLQASFMIEGINHVGTLTSVLGDDADVVSVALDNLNSGLAYIHQDAFKTVYDNFKSETRNSDGNCAEDRSKLCVDIIQQKNMADVAIDKMTSSAIALISQQPEEAQDTAASVWITGITIIADCMEIALQEMDLLEHRLGDFIRLEESWNIVRASVVCAVTGLKGVYRLMDQGPSQDSQKTSPRSSSIASAGSAVFRRLSNAFGPPAPHSRTSSITSQHSGLRNSSISSVGPVYRTPNYVRNSVSASHPTALPSNFEFSRKLSTIPPTPAADDQMDPFDNSVAPPVPQMPEISSLPPLSDPVGLKADDGMVIAQVV